MLTTAYVRAQAAVSAAFATLLAFFAARRATATARYGFVGARGVTFIEYALLAAIAVFLSWLFRGQLSDLFNNLLEKLQGGINDNANHS